MFSHVGLCGLVVLYAMLGGLTFEKIESAEERGTKVKGKKTETLTVILNSWEIDN